MTESTFYLTSTQSSQTSVCSLKQILLTPPRHRTCQFCCMVLVYIMNHNCTMRHYIALVFWNCQPLIQYRASCGLLVRVSDWRVAGSIPNQARNRRWRNLAEEPLSKAPNPYSDCSPGTTAAGYTLLWAGVCFTSLCSPCAVCVIYGWDKRRVWTSLYIPTVYYGRGEA